MKYTSVFDLDTSENTYLVYDENTLSGVIIEAIKYEPLMNSHGVVIPHTDPNMLQAIWTVFTLAPAIGRICKAISLCFFNVNGKVKDQMMNDLAVSRAVKVKERTDD